MQIADRKIGSEYPPFIIAEAGINHCGWMDKAVEMVRVAKDCGADAVKFQTHIADKEMIPTHPLYKKIKRHQLSERDEMILRDYCKECEIIFLSTPYCKEAVDRLEKLGVPAYKIGSGECNNLPLVEYIASKGKPVILSTGMNSREWIFPLVDKIMSYSCSVILMHCVSTYPTPYNLVNLGRIYQLGCHVSIPVGISDHSVGIYTALGAVALGAVAVEKHFKIIEDCPDSAVSIYPNELQELVKGSRAIWLAKSSDDLAVQSNSKEFAKEALNGNNSNHMEEKTSIWAFHSVVTIQDIKKGEILGNSNIGVKRAGKGGIPAKEYNDVLGKFASHNIAENTQLQRRDTGEICTT